MFIRLIVAMGFIAGILFGACHAGTAQTADAKAKADAADAPARFPPGYRNRIAAYLAFEYARTGAGRPLITDVSSGKGPLGTGTSVCIEYPIGPELKRRMVIAGGKNIFTFGRTTFRRTNLGYFDRCVGQLKPFVELEQAGQRLKACQGKGGDAKCSVVLNTRTSEVAVRQKSDTRAAGKPSVPPRDNVPP
jgi:hypothetical protein